MEESELAADGNERACAVMAKNWLLSTNQFYCDRDVWTKESDLVKACLTYLELRGVFAWRNNTTAVYDPKIKRFRRMGSMKGVSDILGILHHGRLLCVECKVGRGKQTKDQVAFQVAVEAHGACYVLARGLDDLERAVNA